MQCASSSTLNVPRPGTPLRQAMQRVRALVVVVGGNVYRGEVPATRSTTYYTARVIPYCAGGCAAVLLEAPRAILWQRC